MLRVTALRAFPDFWKREPLVAGSLSRFLEAGAGTGELIARALLSTGPPTWMTMDLLRRPLFAHSATLSA
jgi:hypothetical protein